jgi:hypothetical protein
MAAKIIPFSKSARKPKQKKPEPSTALDWIRNGFQFLGDPAPPEPLPPSPDNPPSKPGEKGGA